jgi:hypothetical protein
MDFTPYQDYAVSALVVLAALIIVMMLIRTIGSKVRGKQGSRLGISEYYEIDKTRRLVLIRRDDAEHLVMIGGPQDIVIEPGIGLEEIADRRRPETPPQPEFIARRDDDDEKSSVTPIKPRPPKPAIFGDRAPNLRPVEREEPKLDAIDPETGLKK